MKTPKNLGLKIATKEEAFWIKVKEETKAQIEVLENRLKFEKEVLLMATLKIKKAKR